MENKRFLWKVRPFADPKNVVVGKNCRFTVLTDRLIRMEYSLDCRFEDRASQFVFYRDLEPVEYTVRRSDGNLIIQTEKLILQYREGEAFHRDSLWIKLKEEPASQWNFGDDFEDLKGTARTLDLVDAGCELGRGVCSRFGFSVLDDSDTMVLGEDGWVELRNENSLDLYFFGYGYDYLEAVKAFYRISGMPPMLPSYALGNWWSRYHQYTEKEYLDLMDRFQKEDVPFSVAVIDMDWHVVSIPEEQKEMEKLFRSGWTGYTWNTELFPDYKRFLKELQKRNLKTSLNLHPAQGVRKHESMYRQAALAAGIDPESGERVPFDILSSKAMANYFDILHHPYEEDGVDFWWMDWQQGTDYWWVHERNENGVMKDPREKLDPLWMLNHLHILDISRNGKRPMFFSRFSGPGSHRYPVGFSGDTRISWDALAFQPYFTATSSNVGYCWWSHDIGGHMTGYRDDELTVRWVQLGVFSPINRLHSSNDDLYQKEPWCYGLEAEKIISQYLRLRHSLYPYLYTMNYRCHTEGIPLICPMYYAYPKRSEAYEVKNQYLFGSELMVAPITEPNQPMDRLGRTEVWFPAGNWFDFQTGLRYSAKKDRKIEVFRDLAHYPVFAKAGAIVPLAAHQEGDNRLKNTSDPEILVFPGADNRFVWYEDSGDSFEGENGSFVQTELELQWSDNPVFTVHPAQGSLSLIPKERNWNFVLRGFASEVKVKVFVDGREQASETKYSSETHSITLSVVADVTSEIRIQMEGEVLLGQNEDWEDKIFNLLAQVQIDYEQKNRDLSVIRDPNLTLKRKIWRLGNPSPERYHYIKAICEILTLVEKESQV